MGGAFALVVAFSSSAIAGDAIIFSKPSVPIASPPRDESIPEPRAPIFDLSLPAPQQPIVTPPPEAIIRVPGRNEIPDDRHPLLREPRIFSDPDEEKKRKEARENPLSTVSAAARGPSPFLYDVMSPERQEQLRALSPVREMNADSRNILGQRNGLGWERSPWDNSSDGDRRELDQLRSPFNPRDDARRYDPRFDSRADLRGDFARPGSFSDALGGRMKEKMTPAQLERRAEFEQLINPNSAVPGRGPNALEPVANAADARPANLAIPTVGGARVSPHVDPMTTFNQQHERLRGPVVEDVNKKFNSQASPSPYSGNSQTPQKLPPLTREFPQRKF